MIVFVVIGVGLLVSLIAGIRHARQNPRSNPLEEMGALAKREGWALTKSTGGDTVYTVAADDWKLTALFFRGGNRAATRSNHQTEWIAEYPGSDTVLIGPKLPTFIANMDPDSDRLQSLLRPMLGDRIALIRGTRRLDTLGDEQFRKQFDVFASDEMAAERVVGDGSRWTQLATMMAAPVTVVAADHTVTITIRGKLKTARQAEVLIDAGRALMNR